MGRVRGARPVGDGTGHGRYGAPGLRRASRAASQAWTAVRAAAGNTRADSLLPLYPAASYTPIANAFRTLIDDTVFVRPTLDTADAAAAVGSPAWVQHPAFPPP